MTSEFSFVKAERHRVPLRMAIGGPAGSGKTYTALVVAQTVAGSGRVAVIDTEHQSAQLYADLFDFDTLPLNAPFTPERYRLGIRAAIEAGFGALVIDSLTHEWSGEGGVLEMVDVAKRNSKNQYTAWAVPSAQHTQLIEAMLHSPIHVIVTMREKMQYIIEQEAGKKAEIKKVGLQPIQREGTEFEFSIFAEMDMANTLTVTKSRYKTLQGKVIPRPGEEFVGLLLDEVQRGSVEEKSEVPTEVDAAGIPSQSASDQTSEGGSTRPKPLVQGEGASDSAGPPSDANVEGAEVAALTGQAAHTASTDHPALFAPSCPKCSGPMLSGEGHHEGGPSTMWICSDNKCGKAIPKEPANA